MVKRTLWVVGSALALALVGGCGGSSGNNDQGIVFRANGIFRTQTTVTPERITCTEPITPTSSLSDTSGEIFLGSTIEYPDRTDPEGDPCGGQLALENNLTNQSINVQFVTIEYEVPGAAVQPPTYPVNVGLTLPPASCADCSTTGTPGLEYLLLEGQLVPPTILSFLTQNVNRLPATPYTMNLFVTAFGQSDTGTNYQSNVVGYTITVFI